MLRRLRRSEGITILELAIVLVVVGAVVLGCLEFYRAKLHLRDARQEFAASRGRLGVVMDQLARQLESATPVPPDSSMLAISDRFDTLMVFVSATGKPPDTVRYFVNRFDRPPSLIRQVNRSTPTVLAQGIDSARFVPAGERPLEQLSVVLVASEPDPADPHSRFRLGEALPIGPR